MTVKRFWSNRRGATAIEYGLIVALIAIPSITALQSLGTKLATTFETVASNINAP